MTEARESSPDSQRTPSPPGRMAKVLLLLFSTCVALGLAEFALRRLVSLDTILRNSLDDEAWQYRWIEQRREAAGRGQLTTINPLMVYSAELGWLPRPLAQDAEFRINSRGVRGRKEIPYEKSSGERRIVVLGDSFTFAHGYEVGLPPIADDEVYTAVMERELPGTTVVNLGVAGFGTDQQVMYLSREGFRYAPDLVVITLYPDDLNRSLLGFRDYAKPKFVLKDGGLELRGVPVPPPDELEKTLEASPPRSRLWAILKWQSRRAAGRFAPLGWLKVERLNEAIFHRAHDEAGRHNSKLLFVMIPINGFGPELHRAEAFLEDWGKRAGVPVLLLRRPFTQLPPEERGKLYIDHWTPFGHKVAGEAIARKIKEGNLLGSP